MMKYPAIVAIAASTLVALAVWPAVMDHQVTGARAAAVSRAPVERDYELRNAYVAFWEGAVRQHHAHDFLSPRQLAEHYLQRYRETGDVDDVVRARHMAEQSLAIQPRNVAAIAEMASVLLTLHRFREALGFADRLIAYDPSSPEFLAQKANLEMELGEYERAGTTLGRIPSDKRRTVQALTSRSRLDELTGHLARARELLADATVQADAISDAPAQSRAWYHFRAGELAFKAGDNAAAIADEHLRSCRRLIWRSRILRSSSSRTVTNAKRWTPPCAVRKSRHSLKPLDTKPTPRPRSATGGPPRRHAISFSQSSGSGTHIT
jgi:tetratricopeptide (TPR) repeat protein